MQLYLSARYGSEWREFFTQTLIIQAIIQVFHIKINTLERGRYDIWFLSRAHVSYMYVNSVYEMSISTTTN